MASAEDVVKDQTARKRAGEGESTLENAVQQIDERIAYLKFLDAAEEVAVLEPVDPEDGIGEGDVSNLEWRLIPGGQNDFALHKVIEVAFRSLDNWQRWMKGETRLCRRGVGLGGAIEEMYRVAEKYSPENLESEAEEIAAAIIEILKKLAPAFAATRKILLDLGLDPEEYFSQEPEDKVFIN